MASDDLECASYVALNCPNVKLVNFWFPASSCFRFYGTWAEKGLINHKLWSMGVQRSSDYRYHMENIYNIMCLQLHQDTAQCGYMIVCWTRTK